jgi:AcrR family transcriptional regulator
MHVNTQSTLDCPERNETWRTVRQQEAALGSAVTDRRVRRTRESLRSALVSLIEEKGYDRITVQDIIDRADVGRSTFYAHYRDKDDLLETGFQDIRSMVSGEHGAGASAGTGDFLDPLLVVFEHVEGHRQRWRPLVRKGGADLIVRILRESVTDLVHQEFGVHLHPADRDDADLEPARQFVVGAFMGLLVWWLNHEELTHTGAEMHAIFKRLATEGTTGIMAG